ncbi:MAG TPA: hypothetical protein VGM62_07870, partial [Chthoniobacterales bacterium]
MRALRNFVSLGALVLTVCFAEMAGGDEPTVTVSRSNPPSVHLDIDHTVQSVPYDIYRSFQVNTPLPQWDFLNTVTGNGGTVPYDDNDAVLAAQNKAFYRVMSSATPTPTPIATPTATPTPSPTATP